MSNVTYSAPPENNEQFAQGWDQGHVGTAPGAQTGGANW